MAGDLGKSSGRIAEEVTELTPWDQFEEERPPKEAAFHIYHLLFFQDRIQLYL